eukprot:gene22126-biopygen8721
MSKVRRRRRRATSNKGEGEWKIREVAAPQAVLGRVTVGRHSVPALHSAPEAGTFVLGLPGTSVHCTAAASSAADAGTLHPAEFWSEPLMFVGGVCKWNVGGGVLWVMGYGGLDAQNPIYGLWVPQPKRSISGNPRSPSSILRGTTRQVWQLKAFFAPQRIPPGVRCGAALQHFLGEGGAEGGV